MRLPFPSRWMLVMGLGCALAAVVFLTRHRTKDESYSRSQDEAGRRLRDEAERRLPESQLPAELRFQAEDLFASQHDNWLSIRRLSAKYRWTARFMEKGQWAEWPKQKSSLTGTIAFEMVPLTPAEARKLGRPRKQLQLRWRAHANEGQWNVVSSDVATENHQTTSWRDGGELENSSTQPAPRLDLLAGPFAAAYVLMGMSYRDDQWANAIHTPQEYFSRCAPAMRLSTEEETGQHLGYEKSYMFLPYSSQPRVWISARTGHLHQLDLWGPSMSEPGRDVVQTYRYEHYVGDPVSKLVFPSRITDTTILGKDSQRDVAEYTLELSDIRINTHLPSNTFQSNER